ncbi:MAG: sulfatase [bacterium]
MSAASSNPGSAPPHPIRTHALAGLLAGAAVLALLGVGNGAALWKGAESWFATIDGTTSARARAELFRQAPTLFWAVAYDAGLGAVLGGVWGLGVGAWAARRRTAHPARGGLASWHLSAFVWFPFFLIAGLAFAMKRQELHPIAADVLARRLVVNLPLSIGIAWLCHRGTWAVFRWLGARIPFRWLASRRARVRLGLVFASAVLLVSFVPPRIAPAVPPPAAPAPLAATKARPNVLLLVLDTLRADHLGVYGYPKPISPNLDALARKGILYERAHSAGVWTLTGHASLFTGRVPSRSGVNEEDLFFDEDLPTMASVLNRAGYETVGFCNNPWVAPWTGLDRGFENLLQVWREPYTTNLTLGRMAYQYTYWRATGDQAVGGVVKTTEQVSDWLEGRDRSRPFFAFVNLLEAHEPLDWRDDFTPPFVPPGESELAVRNVNQNPYAIWSGNLTMTPADFARYAAMYDGEIHYLDHHLGRWFAELEKRGLFDDTIVVITADHGELIGEHGTLGHHMALWQGVLHVPLIVLDPANRAQAGTRVADVVSTIDVFPTLLDRVGIDDAGVTAPLEGAVLPKSSSSAEGWAVAEELSPRFEIGVMQHLKPKVDVQALYGHRHRAAIRGSWKLLQRDESPDQLFDLASDPGETRDVAAERPDVLGSMRAALDAWYARHPAIEPAGASATGPDAATREQLKNLGYVQ